MTRPISPPSPEPAPFPFEEFKMNENPTGPYPIDKPPSETTYQHIDYNLRLLSIEDKLDKILGFLCLDLEEFKINITDKEAKDFVEKYKSK